MRSLLVTGLVLLATGMAGAQPQESPHYGDKP